MNPAQDAPGVWVLWVLLQRRLQSQYGKVRLSFWKELHGSFQQVFVGLFYEGVILLKFVVFRISDI